MHSRGYARHHGTQPDKPVVGVVGGVGAGKSLVARLFADLGAVWFDADALAAEALETEHLKAYVRRIWGPSVFGPEGRISRQKLAEKAFATPTGIRCLERVIHPWIGRRRRQLMQELSRRRDVKALVLDSPLLFEAYLDFECDCIVFVACRFELRAERLARDRGWGIQEIRDRESKQLPLDFKKDRADYIVENNSDADTLRRQVQSIFSRIIRPPNAR